MSQYNKWKNMSKDQLVKQCKSLDGRRKGAWRLYYEEREEEYDNWQELKELRDALKNINAKGDDNNNSLIIPKHLLEVFTKCEDKWSCSICLEEFSTTKDIFTTKCGHLFHPACIKQLPKKDCYGIGRIQPNSYGIGASYL